MRAQQLLVDTIANNLANVNTTAFKRSQVKFVDALYETLQGVQNVNLQGTETVAPVQLGRGVRVGTIVRVHGQGPLETTNRPLDLAIEGDGFFQVVRPDGSVAYTRDGSFTISDTGMLVTHGGYALLPETSIPAGTSDLQISATGVITAGQAGPTQPVELGRIELARFVNPTGMLSLGENLYQMTPASGEPIIGLPQEEGFGRVIQGSLESSNVEIVQEMVDMISAQRAYELNAKAIQAADEMAQQATSLVR
jgi:flagellar basal-body rod protein FlgG